jgi:hypothetical protein
MKKSYQQKVESMEQKGYLAASFGSGHPRNQWRLYEGHPPPSTSGGLGAPGPSAALQGGVFWSEISGVEYSTLPSQLDDPSSPPRE